MGARAGLGINDSVPNGSIGTENTIPAPTEIDFGDEVIRGFLFDNILHSENDGDIHFGLYIPGSYDGSEPFALFVTLPGSIVFIGSAVSLFLPVVRIWCIMRMYFEMKCSRKDSDLCPQKPGLYCSL